VEKGSSHVVEKEMARFVFKNLKKEAKDENTNESKSKDIFKNYYSSRNWRPGI
jgi:hypothetical protein